MNDPEADTASIESKYLRTVTLHDRVFQQYALENQIYFAPIDADEADRLNHQYAVLNRAFDGRLIFPPIQYPERVLDCGFGAASWAFDVAEQFPDCE
ncbi:MAG: hypothetical protein M1819_003286, partial [Sarea resinae]